MSKRRLRAIAALGLLFVMYLSDNRGRLARAIKFGRADGREEFGQDW
ncbi:MAG TPA: hypothetical protein VFI95_16390 [Terriglobales bacterium]|nr:hypothetical protein [Terriglobales bacterium]